MGLLSQIGYGLSKGFGAAADIYEKRAMEEDRLNLELQKLARIDEYTQAAEVRKVASARDQFLWLNQGEGKAVTLASEEDSANAAEERANRFAPGQRERKVADLNAAKEVELAYFTDKDRIAAVGAEAQAKETPSERALREAQAISARQTGGAAASNAATSRMLANMSIEDKKFDIEDKRQVRDLKAVVLNESLPQEQRDSALLSLKRITGKDERKDLPDSLKEELKGKTDYAIKLAGTGDSSAIAQSAAIMKEVAETAKQYREAYSPTRKGGAVLDSDGNVIGMATTQKEAQLLADNASLRRQKSSAQGSSLLSPSIANHKFGASPGDETTSASNFGNEYTTKEDRIAAIESRLASSDNAMSAYDALFGGVSFADQRTQGRSFTGRLSPGERSQLENELAALKRQK